MTAELFDRISQSGGVVDLSSRAKFLLTGEDRVRYLNGQVTNDVRKATADKATPACVTNVKGRIEGHIFFHISQTDQAGLWIDAEPGLREPLSIRLERYIIADDVTLTDVTEEWHLLHLFGAAAVPWIGKAGSDGVLLNNRFGEPGVDIWSKSGTASAETDAPNLDEEAANVFRVLKGIPRWPEELNAEVFPQEAGLETTAMDFHKGCYIGQEILSRIKTSGKMPRQLVSFEINITKAALPAGGELRLALNAEGNTPKDLGPVTSLVEHPYSDRQIGLAYVRQGTDLKHSLLLVATDPPRIITDARIFSL